MVDFQMKDSIARSKIGIAMPIFPVRMATPTAQVDLAGDFSSKALTNLDYSGGPYPTEFFRIFPTEFLT